MSDEEEAPGRVAIGISFGNSYSSIAFTTSVRISNIFTVSMGDADSVRRMVKQK
jgi:hypothetical protein